MKRVEMMAWGALAALIGVAAICFAGGLMYRTTFFWSGMIVALGQVAVVGLAAWGLSLARQAEDLGDLPPMGSSGGASAPLGMTFGDAPAAAAPASAVRTLELGFQRVLVGLTAAVLVGLSGLIFYLVYATFAWAKANPDKAFPIAGAFDAPIQLDNPQENHNGMLVMGLAAAAIYVASYWLTRPGKRATVEGEAVESNFTLGTLGFVALGAAAVLAFFKLTYASELASCVMAGLLGLQGVELLVNSMRSYSGVEEMDQEAIDLQALPLVPMLASYWLGGVKMLAAQSVGMGREDGERGVIARLMPRALAALVVIALGASCFRVVPPGRVGILERLGRPVGDFTPEGKALPVKYPAGLHITMPWPVDEMVLIPTAELQYTAVGTELHKTAGGENLDFQFWTVGNEPSRPGEEQEDEFATGDTSLNAKGEMVASPQLLETYVGVWWRVKDPVPFYNDLSHSDFYEHGGEGTTTLPIYAALVQQTTGYAVTKSFAIHSLNQILITDRQHVSDECKQILQDKLDKAGSGIEIVDLTIKDLHPPFGRGVEDDASATNPEKKRYGPAFAFENVVNMLEYRQGMIDYAERDRLGAVTRAQGTATAMVSEAQAAKATRIGQAQGEAARLSAMMEEISASPDAAELTKLAKMNALYSTLRDVMTAPAKVIRDPRIPVVLWQKGQDGPGVPTRAASGSGPGQ